MRSLFKTTTVAAVAVFLISGLPGEAQEATPAPQSPKLKPQSDHEKIQGTWRYTTAKIEGNEIDRQKLEMVTFTFSGNTVAVSGLNRTLQTEFSLDATKKPKHIDLKHQADSDGYVIDKGIYRFEDDTLMICTGGFGSPRPTEFETKVSDTRSLMILSRVAEGSSGLLSEAQEATPNPQVPELKPLQRFIGSWEQQVVSKPAEWTPEETTMTLTSKGGWILDGRVLQAKAEWSPSGTKALTLMAYDAENKEYRQWYFDSDGGMPRGENRGRWDEAAKTFTWKGTLPNGVTSSQVHRFIDDERHEWTLVFKDSTGKVLLDMEAKAKRNALVTHSDAQRQEGKAPPPEMKVLEKLVGTWKVEQENKVPEQERLTYVLKGQSILGGRFVQQMGASNDEAEPTQMGIYTYDSSEKNYHYWFFMSSGFFTDITGTWDESSQTFTFTDWLPRRGGATINVRFTDETTYVFSMNTKDASGKVVYQMEGKAVRQK